MKLKRREKRVLAWIGALTYASGVLLFIFAQFVRVMTAVGEQHHWLERLIRASHTTVSYGAVLGVGYLVKGHILPGLRSRSKKQFLSGVGTLLLAGVLTLTALIILYAGEGSWATAGSWTHSLLGLAAIGVVLFHAHRRR